jgi:hypothetical protein
MVLEMIGPWLILFAHKYGHWRKDVNFVKTHVWLSLILKRYILQTGNLETLHMAKVSKRLLMERCTNTSDKYENSIVIMSKKQKVSKIYRG